MPNKLFSEQKRIVNTYIFGFTKTPHIQNDDVLFYNLEDDGFISIQHKGRIDKNGTWQRIEDAIVDAIFNSREIPGVCQKKKIYKDGILNCADIQARRNSSYQMVKISTLFDVKKEHLQVKVTLMAIFPLLRQVRNGKHTTNTHMIQKLLFMLLVQRVFRKKPLYKRKVYRKQFVSCFNQPQKSRIPNRFTIL